MKAPVRRPCTVDSIHLAEVPLHPEENVSAHTQAVAVLLIIGRDCVRQSPYPAAYPL